MIIELPIVMKQFLSYLQKKIMIFIPIQVYYELIVCVETRFLLHAY